MTINPKTISQRNDPSHPQLLPIPYSLFPTPYFLLILFLLAFLPRAIYPVSRPLQWYFRSAEFFQAVMARDWAGTLLAEHPGVTVMWLSGGALWGWHGLQLLLGFNPPMPLDTEGYAFADRVAVSVVPLALVVALGIVWGWHLLQRLFGKRVAWVAALLWALDPFHLTNSKVLHLDATLSTLMVLSALWMLIYLRENRSRPVVISAILGGLAILTKVTGIFLIPFWGLCLLVQVASYRSQVTSKRLRVAISNLLLWILIAAAICFALWPSLWVQPAATLDKVVNGILQKVEQAHSLPRFHRGELMVGDPGVDFYADTLLFRTTFLTLPFCLLGIGVALAQRGKRKTSLLLLIGFILFYFVQMGLASKKESRYMLPIMMIMDVLSAWGIVWWIDRVRRLITLSPRLLIVLLLSAQALVVLPHHPHYGTHYNLLTGGAQAARRAIPPGYFGEGLDLAAQYVDRQPDAKDVVVGTQFLANEMVAQHVRVPVYDINRVEDDVDYLIFGVQYTMRGRDDSRWGTLWEQTYKFREPAFVATFDGITHAWVHRPDATPVVPQQVDARFGDAIRLEGYRLAESNLAPGDTLLLTLYWRAEAPVDGNYTVFTHLQDARGELIAQQDNPPGHGTRPTSGWKVGDLIEDTYEIQIPPDAAYGDDTLSVGMYDPVSLERLTAFDSAGNPLPNNRIMLQITHLRPPVPWWRRALSAAWLAIIVLGATWPWNKKPQ